MRDLHLRLEWFARQQERKDEEEKRKKAKSKTYLLEEECPFKALHQSLDARRPALDEELRAAGLPTTADRR